MDRLLFNPGPTNTSPEVRAALGMGDFSHRDPEVAEAMERIRRGILSVTGGDRTHACLMFACSGTGATEAILSSVRGKILVIVNGRYSQRLLDIAQRYGIPCRVLTVEPFTAVDPSDVAQALDMDPEISHVAVVHHETTTGMLVPLREIGQVVAERDKLLVVDAVSSVGGHEFDLVADNVAFCSLNPNKCIEGLPGIGIVLARESELARMEGHARTFYLDMHTQWQRAKVGQVPYTMPVQILFALDRAVVNWLEEGVNARIDRYARAARYVRKRLEQAGLTVVHLPEACEGNLITTVEVPARVDFPDVVEQMRDRGYTLYSNLDTVNAGRFFVATMGAIDERQIGEFVDVLSSVLATPGRSDSDFSL